MSYFVPLILMCLAVVCQNSEALSCRPCEEMEASCPPAPPAGSCEVGGDICGCCQICKPKEGEECHNDSPNCLGDLICKTGNGCEYVNGIPWYIFIKGVCSERTVKSPPSRCYDSRMGNMNTMEEVEAELKEINSRENNGVSITI